MVEGGGGGGLGGGLLGGGDLLGGGGFGGLLGGELLDLKRNIWKRTRHNIRELFLEELRISNIWVSRFQTKDNFSESNFTK